MHTKALERKTKMIRRSFLTAALFTPLGVAIGQELRFKEQPNTLPANGPVKRLNQILEPFKEKYPEIRFMVQESIQQNKVFVMGTLNTNSLVVVRKIGIPNGDIYNNTKKVNKRIIRLIGEILDKVA